MTYNGQQSPLISRGVNYTAAAVKAAIQAIPGFTGTVTVRSWDGASTTIDDTGFSVSFSGALANVDVPALGLTGATGFVGETTQGGPVRNGGTASATGNRAPVVDTPAAFTIPRRTPFSLTGSATDADGDTLTYLWEQNDAGAGKSLVSNTKSFGPLFRVFGTAAAVSARRHAPLAITRRERSRHEPDARLPRPRPGRRRQHERRERVVPGPRPGAGGRGDRRLLLGVPAGGRVRRRAALPPHRARRPSGRGRRRA